MSRLAGLVDRDSVEATVAWAGVVAVLAAGGVLTRRGDPDWGVVALLLAAVAATPSAVARAPRATFPPELVWLVAAPVVVRALGLLPQATPFFAVAGLSLLALVVVEAETSLSMTPRFAVVFTVVATMALSGVWAVGTWGADALLGTTFVGGKTELMWDLTVATGMGVVAGVVFDAYFSVTDRLDRLRTGGAAAATTDLDDADVDGETFAQADGHRLAVRGMQVLLAGITLYALARGEVGIVVNAGVPLLLTFLPGVLRREYGHPMDAGIVLWLTTAVTLHAVGALGPYATTDWYDTVTHTLSATLVAAAGYAVARAVELHTHEVSFSRAFRGAFVLLFVLAAGVLWELLEFASGGLASILGGEAVLAQYGASDIAKDLLFDGVGGAVVALLATERFEWLARVVAGRVGVLVSGE